jgi:hypothetical protein
VRRGNRRSCTSCRELLYQFPPGLLLRLLLRLRLRLRLRRMRILAGWMHI